MNNRSALLSGGTNRVLLSTGTSRVMGLAPITGAPSILYASSGGTSIFATLGQGWYSYWTTEVYISGTDEVESTFTGTPAQQNVTANAAIVTIGRPATVNSTATHWRAYRSNKQTNQADSAFPAGFIIATVPIATTTFADGGGATSSAAVPTTVSTSGIQLWTSPSNILLDDNSRATFTLTPDGEDEGEIVVGGFGGFSAGNPITDITVQVEAGSDLSVARIFVSLSPNGGVTYTSRAGTGLLTSTLTTVYTLTLPGTWGRTWTAAELANGNFFVKVNVDPGIAGEVISIDVVKVTITHGGTTLDRATLFPSIVISAGPSEASIGANGQPPSASTGDIFQGSLVTNDVANPRQIAWTIPGTLDYSPSIYRMAFDLPVRRVAALGNILVVGLSAQLEGLRFLPLEDDAEFNTGRARFPITTDDGIVGVSAACKFTLGGQQRLFFVGYSQLMMTDGFTAEPAAPDISWNDMTEPVLLSKVHVVKNARYREIKVHYPSRGGSGIDKTLVLSYDPIHLKNGKLKVVGITNYAATCSTDGIFDNTNEPAVFTGRSDGFIYLENRGYSSAAGNTIIPKVSTREMHLAGLGNAWELPSLGIHHQDNGVAALDVSFTATQANLPSRTGSNHTFTVDDRKLSIIDGGEAGEGIIVNLTGRDDGLPLTLDYLVLNTQGLGETATLKS
jgi:hypothetical protein